jgi:hypothetical protein
MGACNTKAEPTGLRNPEQLLAVIQGADALLAAGMPEAAVGEIGVREGVGDPQLRARSETS